MRSEKELRELLEQLQSVPDEDPSYFCLKCRKPVKILSREYDRCWGFGHTVLNPLERTVWVKCLKWVLDSLDQGSISGENKETVQPPRSRQQVEIRMEKSNGKYRVIVHVNGKEELAEEVDDPVFVLEKLERLIRGDRFWIQGWRP